MNNKTVLDQLAESVKAKIPSAATNEALLKMQSEFGKLLVEVKRSKEDEKEQLREAFNRGVVHGMLSSANRNEEVLYGFEQYYKDRYGDDKA